MADSPSFFIERVSVAAGVKGSVFPNRMAHSVNVINATQGDLEVHSTDADNSHYIVIAAGFERPFPGGRIPRGLQPTAPAFWLKPVNDGVVILIWD